MRASVIGQGSIGKRHSENITNLGHEVVPIDLGDALPLDVDCAFICSPTKLHVEHASEYLERNIPVFIEKPITHDLKELNKFVKKYRDKFCMVGCNLRFHPAIRDAKDVCLKHKAIFVRAEYGYYLPFWRKGDYTKSYSAGEDGGIIIDAIHEFDYLYWLFGEFADLKIAYGKVSGLDIKKEDIAEASILFKSGVSGSVHQDYICKNYHRELTINFGHETVKFKIHPTNLMYKKEVEYFMGCVQNKTMPMNNLMEAGYVLSSVLSAKDNLHNTSTSNVDTVTKQSVDGHCGKDNARACNRKSKTL